VRGMSQTRISTRPRFFAILVLLLCMFGAKAVGALSSSQQANDQSAPENHAKIELIAEEDSFRPGHTLWIGLLFQLDNGWHIYWQNPGDSGEPPKVEWSLPAGFQAEAIRWPTPKRLGSGSVVDYGYEGQVLLMVPMRIAASAKTMTSGTIGASVKYLVCREICIPGKADLTLKVSQARSDSAAHYSQQRKLFEQSRAQWPRPAPASWRIAAESQGDHFVLSVSGVGRAQSAEFFPLDPGVIENSASQVFAPSAGGFRVSLKKSDLLTKLPQKLRGVIVVNGAAGYKISATIESH
jgi:DsbC/DsbD-like thiol-disulfide interchange protein